MRHQVNSSQLSKAGRTPDVKAAARKGPSVLSSTSLLPEERPRGWVSAIEARKGLADLKECLKKSYEGWLKR